MKIFLPPIHGEQKQYAFSTGKNRVLVFTEKFLKESMNYFPHGKARRDLERSFERLDSCFVGRCCEIDISTRQLRKAGIKEYRLYYEEFGFSLTNK